MKQHKIVCIDFNLQTQLNSFPSELHMANVINLHPETTLPLEDVLEYVNQNKDDIKELIVLIQYHKKEGDEEDIGMIHTDPSLYVKSALSKLLDYEVFNDLTQRDLTNDED